jgi:hypothetical protein
LDGYQTNIERLKITTSNPIDFYLTPLHSPKVVANQENESEMDSKMGSNASKKEEGKSKSGREEPSAHEGQESEKKSPAGGLSELIILLILAKKMIHKG